MGPGRGTLRGLTGLVLLLFGGTAGPAGSAHAADPSGQTTFQQQIIPRADRGFTWLKTGPGEPYVVRDGTVGTGRGLARAAPGRASRRTSLSYFGQLTDFQIADEESPGRLEYLAATNPAFISGWRPGEATTLFEADRMVRQMNRFRKRPPHRGRHRSRARMDFVVNTGDLADSAQVNEALWSRQVMDGARVRPGSGVDPGPFLGKHPLCPRRLADGLQGMDPAAYAGVQRRSLWTVASFSFWDPDDPNPAAPAGVEKPLADAPGWAGLLDRAQRPFRAAGLKVPGYVVFGNHDRLFQGNVYSRRLLDRIGTGCLKPVADDLPGPGGRASGLPGFASARDFHVRDFRGLYRDHPDSFMPVPPDPARRLISRKEFIRLFRSRNGHRSRGHGFGFVDRSERRRSRGTAGYYSFTVRHAMRYVVLDTTAAGTRHPGSFQGNIDHPQFQWFSHQLRTATRRGQLVIVFSHHAIHNLTTDSPDEIAPACGQVSRREVPGCDGDPRRSAPIHLAADARRLMLQHPNAIAWVAGHGHSNRIDPYRDPRGGHGFWSVQTSSLADWPKQNRLLELFDNHDGTLSLFGTMIDHAAPVKAPPPGPAAGFSPAQLASIGRTVGYNDSRTGSRSCVFGACRKRLFPGPRAERPADRNVELLINDPRR